jgi:hypothetical protein
MRLVPMPTYPVPLMLSPLPDVFLFALELRGRYKSEVHTFSLFTICTAACLFVPDGSSLQK